MVKSTKRVTFKFELTQAEANQLKDLRMFFGNQNHKKLITETLMPRALLDIFLLSRMPRGLSPEQKQAYRRININMKMIHKTVKECLRLRKTNKNVRSS